MDLGQIGSTCSSVPGVVIENVAVRNVHLSVAGGGAIQSEKPELKAAYPEANMFGQARAYGFWIRHARDVTFADTRVTPRSADPRPEMLVGAGTANVIVDGRAVCAV